MADLQNTRITDTGFVKFSTGGTGDRQSPQTGSIRYNTDTGLFEYYDGLEWVRADSKEDERLVGNSSSNPAESGWDLVRERPNISNGYYWIQNGDMPNPLEMYVDTVHDGGGYDFYPSNGDSESDFRNLTGTEINFGLEIVMPRSPNHWRAMSDFTNNVLNTNVNSYFNSHVGKIYRTVEAIVTNTGGAGDYTGQRMRSFQYGGGSAPDWQTGDGGRWWLRDSTYNEPNGDYSFGSPLARRSIQNPYNGANITFNDGNRYTASGPFLYSTNRKP